MKRINATPDLIPHSEFHKGIWLLSVERPSWYYFVKRKSANVITAKQFIKTVDPALRKLVAWLHKRKIKTTPSCSGHHLHEKDLVEIYRNLEKDAETIRTTGLWLTDAESGKKFYFSNKHYSLPWTLTEFKTKVIAYQKNGVLGMHLKNKQEVKNELLKLDIPGVKIQATAAMVFIFTKERKGRLIKTMWDSITNKVIDVLANTFTS